LSVITAMDAEFWNHRYARDDFVYGTEPNDLVAEVAARIPPGPVLCLAEGEGRNAVYLASLGHAVTAVDLSMVALGKAQKLAAVHGVKIETVVADLAAYRIEPGAWAGDCSDLGAPAPAAAAKRARASCGRTAVWRRVRARSLYAGATDL
jgi:SAM-dependent methyltransferase